LRRKLSVLAVGFVIVALAAPPALAHVIYTRANTYVSDSFCVDGYNELSHGDGGGYSKFDTESESWGGIEGDRRCTAGLTRPAGYISVGRVLYKWDGANWSECRRSLDNYNSVSAWKVSRYIYSSTPCGPGYYSTTTFHYVYNNGWYGGPAGLGNSHYLPA
jgi:hypothetical protein